RTDHWFDIAGAEQTELEPVHLLANRVVLFPKLNDVAELRFELLSPFAQREYLALADGNGTTTVRMRNVDIGEHLGVLLEKLRVFPKIRCYGISCHGLWFGSRVERHRFADVRIHSVYQARARRTP